jgi:hypothetical protein
MNRADTRAWQSARTLADLGELTARWLEGDIAEQPCYAARPATETDSLIPVLAALNRAVFVTSGSQPGCDGKGYDGAHWKQRAAVEAYADRRIVSRIVDVLDGHHDLAIIAFPPSSLPRWRYRYDQAVAVTRTDGCDPACPTRHPDGCDYTWFGTQVPGRHLRDPHLGYGTCHRAAVAALCAAWQVTVIDLEWGRNDLLWPLLAGIAAGAA